MGLTVWFLYPILLHFTAPIHLQDDVAYGYFLFDTNVRHIIEADWGHIFESRMFYPIARSMTLGNNLLGQAVMGFPVYVLTQNSILAANAVMVMDYFLTFLFTYLLAYTLTGSWQGSIVAGLVFSFNPYMLSRQHQELIVFEWIPLLFLAAEKLIRKVSWQWVVVGVVAYVFCLISSFYYAYIAFLSVALYILVRCVCDGVPVKRFLRPAIVLGVIFVFQS